MLGRRQQRRMLWQRRKLGVFRDETGAAPLWRMHPRKHLENTGCRGRQARCFHSCSCPPFGAKKLVRVVFTSRERVSVRASLAHEEPLCKIRKLQRVSRDQPAPTDVAVPFKERTNFAPRYREHRLATESKNHYQPTAMTKRAPRNRASASGRQPRAKIMSDSLTLAVLCSVCVEFFMGFRGPKTHPKQAGRPIAHCIGSRKPACRISDFQRVSREPTRADGRRRS
jgi:hypothetical protein